MVKDRNELLQVSRQNAQQLKAHLRKSIIAFMRMQNVSADELAYVLGITNAEMEQILDGDGNVTVDVLSKLLVATDNVVEIKPIAATPMRGFGPGMPQSGGFPGIPVDENGRPIPPEVFMGHDGLRRPNRPMGAGRNGRGPVAPATDGQPRDAHGRFTSRNTGTTRRSATNRPAARPTAAAPAQENPYASISADALINIIRQNLWDGEIDLAHATQTELADFVFNKENLLRQRTEERQTPVREARPVEADTTDAEVRGSDSVNQFLEMLGNVAREAQNNPALAETIARFMPKH